MYSKLRWPLSIYRVYKLSETWVVQHLVGVVQNPWTMKLNLSSTSQNLIMCKQTLLLLAKKTIKPIKTLPNKETLSFSFTGCNASFNQSQTAQKLCTVYIYNLVTSHTRKLFFKKLPFIRKHTGFCFSWYKVTGATRLPCSQPNQLHDQELRNSHTSKTALQGVLSACVRRERKGLMQLGLFSVGIANLVGALPTGSRRPLLRAYHASPLYIYIVDAW